MLLTELYESLDTNKTFSKILVDINGSAKKEYSLEVRKAYLEKLLSMFKGISGVSNFRLSNSVKKELARTKIEPRIDVIDWSVEFSFEYKGMKVKVTLWDVWADLNCFLGTSSIGYSDLKSISKVIEVMDKGLSKLKKSEQ